MRRPARGAVAERTAPQNPAAKLGQFYSDPLKLRRGFPLVEICLLHYRDRNSRRARVLLRKPPPGSEQGHWKRKKMRCFNRCCAIRRSFNPRLCKARLPAPHRRPAHADAVRHALRRASIRRGQHNAGPLHVLARPVAVGHDHRQPLPFRSAENHTNRLSCPSPKDGYCLAYPDDLVNPLNGSPLMVCCATRPANPALAQRSRDFFSKLTRQRIRRGILSLYPRPAGRHQHLLG